MKTCNKCGLNKEDSDFVIRKSGRLESYCRECHAAYHLEWYKENGITRRKQIKERKRENILWFRELKNISKLKCKVCGEDRLPTLDFHHKNPSDKEGSMSRLLNRGFSRKRMLEEVEKCDILCSNCHRMLHAESL